MPVRLYRPGIQSPTWMPAGLELIADRRRLRAPGTVHRDPRSGAAVAQTGTASAVMAGTSSVLYDVRSTSPLEVWTMLAQRVPVTLEHTTVAEYSIARFVVVGEGPELETPRPGGPFRILTFDWETI